VVLIGWHFELSNIIKQVEYTKSKKTLNDKIKITSHIFFNAAFLALKMFFVSSEKLAPVDSWIVF
jgi:hypothetical protein